MYNLESKLVQLFIYIHSHFYIIVVINSSAITDVEDLTTQQLLEHSMSNSMLFYIAAVVNASQYVQYLGVYRMKYALGAGDRTTDIYGNVFYNREVKSEYSFFYRVFSANSTPEVYYKLLILVLFIVITPLEWNLCKYPNNTK